MLYPGRFILVESVALILPEKISKMLSPNNPGFIDVNRAVQQSLYLVKVYYSMKPVSSAFQTFVSFTRGKNILEQLSRT